MSSTSKVQETQINKIVSEKTWIYFSSLLSSLIENFAIVAKPHKTKMIKLLIELLFKKYFIFIAADQKMSGKFRLLSRSWKFTFYKKKYF